MRTRIVSALAAACALLTTTPAHAQNSDASPWTIALTTSPSTLAVGACSNVFVSVKDQTGKDAPRTSTGARITIADFDLKASGAAEGSVVGNYQGPTAFTVCACQSSVVGTAATVVATYPSAALVAKGTQLEGRTSQTSITVPIASVRGKAEAPGCASNAATVTLMAAPMITGTLAAPSLATAAGPPIGPQVLPYVSQQRLWNGTITVDGKTSFAQLVRGGSPYRRVIATGAGSAAEKHLSARAYEPIVVMVRPTPAIVGWINSAWTGAAAAKNGGIVAELDPAPGQPAPTPSSAGKLVFSNATVVSTTIPALSELMSNERGRLTVVLAPALVRRGTGTPASSTNSNEPHINSFKLAVSGLESTGVYQIQSFSVGNVGAEATDGAVGTGVAEPGAPVFPNLFVSIAPTSSAWVAWYQDFVVDGHNGSAQEKTFTLDLVGSNQATLGTIKGFGVGIVALRAIPLGQGTGFQAELYVERMEFSTPTVAAP